MTRRSIPFAVLAAAYLGLIGLVTLGPTPWRTRPPMGDYDVLSLSTWLDPETWSRTTSPEFVANVVLFVPLGLLLRLALPRATWVGAVLLGGAVSVAIEILQMATSRISDPRDVVANTLGAVIGALLGAILAAVSAAVRAGIARGANRVRALPDRVSR